MKKALKIFLVVLLLLIAQLEALMPLTVNQFEVKNGSVTFQDPSVTPPVNLRLDDVYLEAYNLSNVRDSLTELPASMSAAATSVGGGKLSVDMKMNILNKLPEFDARLKLMSVDLTQLNDFIKAYANFDVQQGTFSLITEMKADNGKLNGYIKPFFENLDVFDMKQKDGFFQKVWEGLGAEALENQPQDRVATQVPIQGDIQSPDTNVPVTIFNIFRNAFVDAINKEFEKNAGKS